MNPLPDDVQKQLHHFGGEESIMGKPSPYGYCPVCGGEGFSRERRPFGNDNCENGHEYPSATALKERPLRKSK